MARYDLNPLKGPMVPATRPRLWLEEVQEHRRRRESTKRLD